MALPKTYSTGTVSVSNGSTAVTGVGTSWLSTVKADDVFRRAGYSVRVASVTDDTHLVLAENWPGTTLTTSAYEIAITFDGPEFLQTARKIWSMLSSLLFYVADATSATYQDFYEQTTNGTNKFRLSAAANLAADVTGYLTAAAADLWTRWTSATVSVGASLDFPEGTTNGTNKATVRATAALAADRVFLLPDSDVTFGAKGIAVVGAADDATARGLIGVKDATSLTNLGLAFSVAGNALTCSVKLADGTTTPTSETPIVVAMRDATVANGKVIERSITGALSLTISSGSTLGHVSGLASAIYWYLIDNAGTLELAASFKNFGEAGIVSTTAEGGAGAADTGTVMYSATARTNVPFVRIGYSIDTQTAAGTWTATPTTVLIGRSLTQPAAFSAHKNGTDQTSFPSGADTKVTATTEAFDTGGYYDATNSRWYPPPGLVMITFTVRFTAGLVDQYPIVAEIYKNGSSYKQGAATAASGAGGNQCNNITIFDQASGSDYYEAYAYCGGAGTKTVGGSSDFTYFMGALLQ